MPVTKQTYTASATWTIAQFADLLRDAFIDAGLMAAWHDSFSLSLGSEDIVRVLKIEHDSTKTYGSSFYAFHFNRQLSAGGTNVTLRLHLASGWNAAGAPPVNVPTGVQYLDYERLPANYSTSSDVGTGIATLSGSSFSTTSNLSLDRYTSQDDSKQSWFVVRNGLNRTRPFTVLHKDTVLHSWLNLDQGMISGFHAERAARYEQSAFVSFRLQENLRRCLLMGTALRGATGLSGVGWRTFHNFDNGTHTYQGPAALSNSITANMGGNGFASNYGGSAVILPVGKSSANPGFVTDYIPVCSELPWSPWTPTLLADDFGICMYYEDNVIDYGDRIIVQSALNEWQVIDVFNSQTVNDAPTATFLARLI